MRGPAEVAWAAMTSTSVWCDMVLQHAVRARRDAEITRRLNDLFATPDLAKQLSREASELDGIGTDRSDERW